MRLLRGMLVPDAGRALLRDDAGLGAGRTTGPGTTLSPVDVRQASPAAWTAVGHLVEAPFGYAELTVTETAQIAARLRGMAPADAAAQADRVIEALTLGSLGCSARRDALPRRRHGSGTAQRSS